MTAPLVAPPRSTIAVPPGRPGIGDTTRTRSAAVQRAYARRAQRTGALPANQDSAEAAGRAPFVVLVMVLLSVALVATLWLSTAAAADSYRLQHAREAARDLTERSEQLGREVATLETAPELARRALELGMVPAGDPVRLVVRPDGTVVAVGEPEAAVAPPALPSPASIPAPPVVPPPVVTQSALIQSAAVPSGS